MSAVTVSSSPSSVPASQPPSTDLYSALLQSYVTDDGKVDYRSMKADPRLNEYCNMLSSSNPQSFDSWQSQITFWINVYNAFTLKLICDNLSEKLTSINNLHMFGSLAVGVATKRTIWHTYKFRIGGVEMTLDQVEHEILRGKFKDPRIHAAINCASGSCPILLNKPYSSDTIEAQLEKQMREFVKKTQLDFDTKTATFNQIFKWFSDDFTKYLTDNGGDESVQAIQAKLDKEQRAGYEDAETRAFDVKLIQPPIMQFLFLYSTLDMKKRLMAMEGSGDQPALSSLTANQQKLKGKKWNIKYEEYDWSLNKK